MDNFDLKKYLAEGKLLKEEIMVDTTIMFGGKGKDNSLKALWDSISGDASTMKGEQDGNIDNELAGFDLKYSFNLNNVVWSFYGQYIGEDGTDYWPWRTFYSLGTEFVYLENGKLRSLVIEYIDTYYNGVDTGTNITYEHGSYTCLLYTSPSPRDRH